MSSNMTPASFASAAAGQSRGNRSGDGSGEWSRREGRSTNGTLTFRRSANAPSTQPPSSAAADAMPALPPSAESQPAQQSLPSTSAPQRYTRDQLLDIFKSGAADPSDVSRLFVSGWDPTHANGTARGWGKSSDGIVPQDPTVCWDASGSVRPIAFQEPTAEEKELFVDVSSTLKPQQQKDGAASTGNSNGRKTSVSHGSAYNVSSPLSATRPAARRRETTDTNPFSGGASLTSPMASRTPRDESSWFGRKGNDQREPLRFEEPEEEPSLAKSVGLAATGRSSTAGAVPSLWGSAAAAPAPASALGAFGSFALPPVTDKRFGSVRGESRLAHLLPKLDATDAAAPGAKLSGAGASIAATKDSWRTRPRTDTDPFSEDAHHPFDTPIKSTGAEFGMAGLNLGSSLDDDGAASPETNPFRSPPAERGDDEHHPMVAMSGGFDRGLAGMGGPPDHAPNFGSLRGYPSNAFDGSDRSQTSSVGAKGFSSLGNIAGWGNALNTSTPDRDRAVFTNAFGNSLFSPVTGELPSPGFGGGVPGVFGAPGPNVGLGGTGSLRGTSKLGSLFPPSMQAQMAGNQDADMNLGDSIPDLRQTNPLGAIGREAIGSQGRESDAQTQLGRVGLFDDLTSGLFSAPDGQSGILASGSPMHHSQPFDAPSHPNTDASANQPRIMVMPDRMRWVYLDPQGQTQGPFTGLEMNDWYKAQFFTADLRVKKVEDIEFEPLGQLIRRIGNSREPFLVPQMGVPHGQPSLSGTFAHGDRGTVIPPLVGAFPSYGRTLTAEEQNNLERRKQEEQYMLARQREMLVHHPFPGARPPPAAPVALHHHSSVHSLQSQPSFGSITSPLRTGPPIAGALGVSGSFFDHGALPPTTTLPAVGSGSDLLRDDLNAQERQILAGLQASGAVPGAFPPPHAPSLPSLPTDSHLHSHLPGIDQLQKDPQGFSERLREFHQLREGMDTEEALAGRSAAAPAAEAEPHDARQQASAAEIISEAARERAQHASNDAAGPSRGSLSLTEQVQNAQAAAAKRRAVEAETTVEEAYAEEVHTDLPMPFPPPQGHSGTHIAAPTAQRTRSTLPDQYATSRSQSQTPESAAAGSASQPPPLAPWAREPGAESHKGPSLKEIQEAEAKKAAKAEEAASAQRKALAEQEASLLREREQKAAIAAATGLATTSTWATSSPMTTTASSPWAKPGAPSKPAAAGPASGSATPSTSAEKKKTLAEIQREEELRKQRARELAAASHASTTPVPSAGKRYADLASKGQAGSSAAAAGLSASPLSSLVGAASAGGAAVGGAGWATVGAGGKVRSPASSSTSRPSSAAPPAATKPLPTLAAAGRSVSKQSGLSGRAEAGGVAMDEFNKWLHRELSRGLSSTIDLDGFVDTLQQLPMDQTIISEAVYANSKTMDARHFADEFIRRRKLAEKGVVEKQAVVLSSSDNKSVGGWSEVAKKGGSNANTKEENTPAGFKVVPSRKKGKK